MSLRNVMRKAAGLLVEIPDDGMPLPETESAPQGAPPASQEEPDIDALLAAVRGPKAPGATATTPAKTPLSSGASAAPAPGTAAPARAPQTAAQIASTGGPNLEQIKTAAAGAVNPSTFTPGAPAQAGGPGIGPDGKIKLPVIYDAAGVPPTPFSAEQALELITALPADLPLEVKRQTVKATLSAIGKTLGATPQTIVGDATRKVAALEAYLESFTKKSEEFTKKVEGDIAALEAQITEKRRAIETAKRRVNDLSKFCDQEAEKLDDVLEFFSLDIGPSKYAPENQPTPQNQPATKSNS